MAEKKVIVERRPVQNARSGASARPGSAGTGSRTSPPVRRETAQTGAKTEKAPSPAVSEEVEKTARKLLAQREKRRKRILVAAILVAIGSVVYLGAYSYYEYRTSHTYQMLSNVRERERGSDSGSVSPSQTATEDPVEIHYTDGQTIAANVLPEYEDLLKYNKKLIGWLKIADTNIDYPVMQTDDNEYYLTHNLKQEYDKNGSIFMDTACDVLKPSTNFILYGHHMRSGNMFGNLTKYEKESYWEKHKLITFDTIYEHGTYEVMYVFRSHVYAADEIAFKYYQFIDCNGEVEFASNMEEMAKMSLYDTGVTATYGDRLLTLSTCDYEEAEGRFVVVAKRIGD